MTRSEELANPKQHGYYAGYCAPPCHWITVRRGSIPGRCDKCGTLLEFDPPSQPETHGYVQHVDGRDGAALICSVAENESTDIRKLAERHGYLVCKRGKKTQIFKYGLPFRIKYADKEARCYTEITFEFEGSWQAAMKFLRDNTPNLPAYLRDK